VKAGEAHPLFESRIVDKKLDVVAGEDGIDQAADLDVLADVLG
jgi:hypothetical protein